MAESIVVVGGANVDVKARMRTPASVLATSHPGTVWSTTGGVAANIAVNLAQLGASVRLMAPLGDDERGVQLRQQLAALGVLLDPAMVFTGQHTGTYVAVLQENGDLVTAVSDMSIMDTFTPDILKAQQSFLADALAVGVDANLPAATLAFVIRAARKAGVRAVIDPVSVAKADKLLPLLPELDTITPNRDELAALAGKPVETLADAEHAAAALQQQGVETILVTLGSDGVLACTSQETRHYPAEAVQITDATGAGDAFTAGIVYGYAQAWPLGDCISFGQQLARRILSSTESVLGGRP